MLWHPPESDLALVKAGDLGGWKKRLLERHLAACEKCASEAEAFSGVTLELRGLAGALDEPPFLAARILAAVQTQAGIPVPQRQWAAAGAVAVLVLLALILIGHPAGITAPSTYQASAAADAVIGEVSSARGHQRVVLYTGSQGAAVQVSAGAGALGVSHADPATGAVTITLISVGE